MEDSTMVMLLSFVFSASTVLMCGIYVPWMFYDADSFSERMTVDLSLIKAKSDKLWKDIRYIRQGLPDQPGHRSERQVRLTDGVYHWRRAASERSSMPDLPAQHQMMQNYGMQAKPGSMPMDTMMGCQCSRTKAMRCPMGQPGPSGAKGRDGKNGSPGLPGRSGISMQLLQQRRMMKLCPICEGGRSGLLGRRGRQGRSGQRGRPGRPAYPRSQGKTGPPGPQGMPGDQGFMGHMGPMGMPGSPAVGGLGPPGLKGPPGYPGKRGQSGPRAYAKAGMPGRRGMPGQRGMPGGRGMQGSQGQQGHKGMPGRDAQYCPCPDRGQGMSASYGGNRGHMAVQMMETTGYETPTEDSTYSQPIPEMNQGYSMSSQESQPQMQFGPPTFTQRLARPSDVTSLVVPGRMLVNLGQPPSALPQYAAGKT